MEYLHDRERSLACLRNAVALMAKHSEVLDPLSYAVWYDYAADGSPELKKILDASIAGGGLLSPATVRDLFLRFVAQPDVGHGLEALAQMISLTLAVNQSTDMVIQANRQFGDSLATFEGRLETPASAGGRDFGGAVGDMLQATRRTSDSMQHAAGLLAQHSAEMNRLRAELELARHEASIDALTQVLNRRAFDRALQQCLEQLEAGAQQSASLMVIDIDAFKQLNDSFGHAFGDMVLGTLAKALQAAVGPGDSVGRLGGDEFALLLPGRSEAETLALGERVRALIAGARVRGVQDAGTAVPGVTISCGEAGWRRGDGAMPWLKRADAALYEAKRLGRNRVSWATETA
jgi:diguanylate cyclase